MAKEQGECPEDGIHADLGQNTAEKRAQACRRLKIRTRQPEKQGKDGGLGTKDKQKHHGQDGQHGVQFA